jgi:hypothetical protein
MNYYVSPDNRLMSTPIRVLPDAHAIEPGTPVSLFPVHLAAGAISRSAATRHGLNMPWRLMGASYW